MFRRAAGVAEVGFMAVAGEAEAEADFMEVARGQEQVVFMAGHDRVVAMLAALLRCRDPAAEAVRPSNGHPAGDNRWASCQHRAPDQARVRAVGKLHGPAVEPVLAAAALRVGQALAADPAVNSPAVDDQVSAISTTF